MAREKARYVGDGAGKVVDQFEPFVWDALRKHYRPYFNREQVGVAREVAEGFDDPAWREAEAADEFISELLAASYPLKVELRQFKESALKKGELKAERADLLKSLEAAREKLETLRMKLRSVSEDLNRVLGFDTAVLDTADCLEVLEATLKAAGDRLDAAEDRPRARVFSCRIANELIEVVSAVDLEIKGSASAPQVRPSLSVLKCIGDAIGLHLTLKTWANRISELRSEQVDSR